MKNKQFKVVKINKNEFELDNGDVYPINFDLIDDITIEEFQLLLDNSKEVILNLIKNINEK